MKKLVSVVGVVSALYVMPLVASAQDFGKLEKFFEEVSGLISSVLIPLIFALALLLFLWGALKYFIWGGADEEKRKEGRQLMIYSVVAFVLMISIWGIVEIISEIFGIESAATPSLPGVPKN